MIFISSSETIVQQTSLPESFRLKLFSSKIPRGSRGEWLKGVCFRKKQDTGPATCIRVGIQVELGSKRLFGGNHDVETCGRGTITGLPHS